MSLEVRIAHRLGAFALDAQFTAPGGITVLFGRSGSGKTSVVNAVAGLMMPREGRIVVDGEVLLDTARKVAVPAHRRRIGTVFQDARLFPHLTVRQNIEFGTWFSAQRPPARLFESVVGLLGIEGLLARSPTALSGGEKSRVAIGRALLTSPRALLLDEPLAALDEARKAEILPYLERLRDEFAIPMLYVSHALPEVTRLATTVVVMANGQVVGVGPVTDVLADVTLAPTLGRFEAGAVLPAEVVRHISEDDLSVLLIAGRDLVVPRIDLPVGARLRVRVRSRDVAIALRPPQDVSILNALEGRLTALDQRDGPFVEATVDLGGAAVRSLLTRASARRLGLAPGQTVWALIKTASLDSRSVGFRRRARSGRRSG
ncbi:MAG: molybdenum ABC transporter ATP-binding protein [Hyphomicrobiaceae bacterium]|nr:molybdenum ABC transporter ATP-binding protein [Hyphomicrobiaceae bacterium]